MKLRIVRHEYLRAMKAAELDPWDSESDERFVPETIRLDWRSVEGEPSLYGVREWTYRGSKGKTVFRARIGHMEWSPLSSISIGQTVDIPFKEFRRVMSALRVMDRAEIALSITQVEAGEMDARGRQQPESFKIVMDIEGSKALYLPVNPEEPDDEPEPVPFPMKASFVLYRDTYLKAMETAGLDPYQYHAGEDPVRLQIVTIKDDPRKDGLWYLRGSVKGRQPGDDRDSEWPVTVRIEPKEKSESFPRINGQFIDLRTLKGTCRAFQDPQQDRLVLDIDWKDEKK